MAREAGGSEEVPPLVVALYEQLAGPVLVGMEATGNSQRFIELVEDLGQDHHRR